MGERPIVALHFADFVTCRFDVIVSVAAKTLEERSRHHSSSGCPAGEQALALANALANRRESPCKTGVS
jgi:hypothetical protein